MSARGLLSTILSSVRPRVGRVAMDTTWRLLAESGRLPAAQPKRHGVERLVDLAYAPSSRAEHTLDFYRPLDRAGPLPVVVYLHGGGFRVLSKDTHWVMGLAFARQGYVVFLLNYRLAPAHPYPAAVIDACAGLGWVYQNAARFGGDPSRVVLAGESAGANLVTSLAIAACFERPEPWARAIFDAGVRPSAVLPACGILQVTDVARLWRAHRLSSFVRDRLLEVETSYLPVGGGARDRDLADPLLVLEGGAVPVRPLPPFFLGVGTGDVLSDDTRRLEVALARRGVPCTARYYPGEPHAFHALVWRANAKAFWRDTFTFLDLHAPSPHRASALAARRPAAAR